MIAEGREEAGSRDHSNFADLAPSHKCDYFEQMAQEKAFEFVALAEENVRHAAPMPALAGSCS